MRKSKIIVVGAGPAGSACALVLARSGAAEVTLLDRSVYPRLKVCGSGLSPHAQAQLRALGLQHHFAAVAVPMRGLVARGPEGTTVRLRGSTGALIVPRTELDHGLVQEAVRAGARFREAIRVDELVRDPDGDVVGVRAGDTMMEADLVVLANGSPSRFERQATPRHGIRTIMGWWRGAELREPDMGEMIWDRRLDGYYAWLFPEPGGVVNIGLTIGDDAEGSHHLRELFRVILDEHFVDTLRNAEQIGAWKGHPATVTTRIGDIAERHALWVGEAARLVSPGTVEGIGFALESGALAGRMLAKYVKPQTGMSPAFGRAYRATLAARMLPKFFAGQALADVMRSARARNILATLIDPNSAARWAAGLVEGQDPGREQVGQGQL